jgi:hypothetical protein
MFGSRGTVTDASLLISVMLQVGLCPLHPKNVILHSLVSWFSLISASRAATMCDAIRQLLKPGLEQSFDSLQGQASCAPHVCMAILAKLDLAASTVDLAASTVTAASAEQCSACMAACLSAVVHSCFNTPHGVPSSRAPASGSNSCCSIFVPSHDKCVRQQQMEHGTTSGLTGDHELLHTANCVLLAKFVAVPGTTLVVPCSKLALCQDDP